MQQRNSSEQSKKRRRFDTRSAIALVGAVVLFYGAHIVVGELDKQEAAKVAATQTSTQAEVLAVKPTPVADKPIVEPETEEAEAVMIFDVPLDAELQLFIIQACEEHHIEPAIIMAMIQNESSFRANVIGDSGNAFGLMQVWPKWHQERMNRLGVTDLLDPRQNVAVGMDYLFELLDRGNGLEWALMAYAAGPTGANSGIGSSYASRILTNSEILKEGMIVCD